MPQSDSVDGTNLVVFSKFEPKFKVGDIVTLKSGSPRMTVIACDHTGVEVQWFTQRKLNQASYPLNAVQLARTTQNASV